MPLTDFERELARARRHLASADPVLKRHLQAKGPCTLEKASRFVPFHALLSSIAHQQLNGKAAQTILGRFKERVGAGRWPTPEQVKRARMTTLRACGLSGSKSVAMKDLAQKTLTGIVPGSRALHAMSDDDIVTRLTQVRGIGPWTVQMMLMFRLGRLDVMPIDDFGVRKGYSVLYGLEEMVKPKALLALAEPWKPYRSVAAWYLWRVLDA